jgi:hypothetical protein
MTDYDPTDWVDGVTDVNEVRMDKIEAGIDSAHDEIIAVTTRVTATEARLVPVPADPADDNKFLRALTGAWTWVSLQISSIAGLQAALDAKVDDAEKGAASGVATLDSSSKLLQEVAVGKIDAEGVPDGQVPTTQGGNTVFAPIPAGGAELQFLGNWGAGVQYTDGDCVVYNGVVYMCVEAPAVGTPPESWGV